MSTVTQQSGSGSARPANLKKPPAADWQQKTYRLFLNRLTLPLLGLALVFAGVGATAFVAITHPQQANAFYPLLGALLLAWGLIAAATSGETVVITVGGGGIPVIRKPDGELQGVAAVIDKDFASSLLARLIHADLLLISTAVEKVAINFGKPEQKWLDKMTLAEAKAYLAEGTHFAKGSMAPKIQAVIWFLENGGKQAIITNPENIGRAIKGETGTLIVP